jgi:hypothetical protein
MDNNKPKRKYRRKKKLVKRDPNTLRLSCINEDSKFEIIEFPAFLKGSYIKTFGTLTVRTKEEMKNWLAQNNVF